jgi:hypothetical protein
MANEKQLDILKQGVYIWNKWRSQNPEEYLDLQGLDLSWSDVDGKTLNLGFRKFKEANLCGIDLRQADLRGARLDGADICWADLRSAYLREADLREADLSETYLSGADLRRLISVLQSSTRRISEGLTFAKQI